MIFIFFFSHYLGEGWNRKNPHGYKREEKEQSTTVHIPTQNKALLCIPWVSFRTTHVSEKKNQSNVDTTKQHRITKRIETQTIRNKENRLGSAHLPGNPAIITPLTIFLTPTLISILKIFFQPFYTLSTQTFRVLFYFIFNHTKFFSFIPPFNPKIII